MNFPEFMEFFIEEEPVSSVFSSLGNIQSKSVIKMEDIIENQNENDIKSYEFSKKVFLMKNWFPGENYWKEAPFQ